VLLVVVEPDFGGVVSPAAVDVEESARVGHGGDPAYISNAVTAVGEGGVVAQTYQYWPLPFRSGMICGSSWVSRVT
jgi:hypothetical protein